MNQQNNIPSNVHSYQTSQSYNSSFNHHYSRSAGSIPSQQQNQQESVYGRSQPTQQQYQQQAIQQRVHRHDQCAGSVVPMNQSPSYASHPQTIQSIRNMYMSGPQTTKETNASSNQNSSQMQGSKYQSNHDFQSQRTYQPMFSAQRPFNSNGQYSNQQRSSLNGSNMGLQPNLQSKNQNQDAANPTLAQTKRRVRGIGYDQNYNSLFNDKPHIDRWEMLRNQKQLNPLIACQTGSTAKNQDDYAPRAAGQNNSYNFDTPQNPKPKSSFDFYSNMAEVYIQKKQRNGSSPNREKYAAGYDQSQIPPKKQQHQTSGRNQIQNKKSMNNQNNMQATSKKRKFDDGTITSIPSQISDAPVQSSNQAESQPSSTTREVPRKGKKKLKRGWNGGDGDSCLNDPYGDDQFKSNKKKKRGHGDDLEDAIERGGSSQDKFESDFIDDESLGNQKNNSSEDEDLPKKHIKSKKDKKDRKEVKKTEKTYQSSKNGAISDGLPDDVEEYGISSNEIDEEELQGYMDDWEKSPEKDDYVKSRKKTSKGNTTKNSSKSKQVKQVQKVQKHHILQSEDDEKPEQLCTDKQKTDSKQKDARENDDGEQSDFDVYNSLTRYVQDSKRLKLKFRIRAKNDCVYLPDDFLLPKKTYDNLFDHQKQGIQWMYSLWQRQMGGVLGDDMGLGKTVQVAVFLKGLFDSEQIRKVLIVVPATMKVYWQEELLKWTADDFDNPCDNEEEQLNIMQFDDKKKQNRHAQMKSLRKNGGILITSYGMVTTERINLTDMKYDVIVLDEGHKVKNKGTQFRKDITSLRVKGCRLVLTGTPLQNNLNELWSVFDFVQPKIFGNFEKFQIHYGGPIEKGLLKDSTDYEKKTSQYLSKELKTRYQDHFLRRTKKNIFSVISSEQVKRPLRISELPLKTDIVIWLPLLESQKSIYKHILNHNQKHIDQLHQDGDLKNAFFILGYIKKLCLHPYLLQTTAIHKKKNLGISSPEEDQILAEQERVHKESAQNVGIRTRRGQVNRPQDHKEKKRENSHENKENVVKTMNGKLPTPQKPSPQKQAVFNILQGIQTFHNKRKIEQLVNSSSKTKLLFRLMQTLKDEGHRVLIFSMSKKMLDLMEFIIKNNSTYAENFKYVRIDGDTEIASREQICKQFNNDKSFFCGLLTTKVGGFGLNLTGADRAIIMDPDWNPANDNQAVDRCYRIGQKRDVIVYRLVTIGGIEEMIYRRQVHKKGMNLATIEGAGGKQDDHEINSSQSDDGGNGDPNDDKNKVSDEKAFEKYFNDSDLFKLFVFTDDDDHCATLKMILRQNGFNYERTPTNLRHIKYLQDQDDLIKGTTLNSNLYISKEDLDGEDIKGGKKGDLDKIEKHDGNDTNDQEGRSRSMLLCSEGRNSQGAIFSLGRTEAKTFANGKYSQGYKKTSSQPDEGKQALSSVRNLGKYSQPVVSQDNKKLESQGHPADIFKALANQQKIETHQKEPTSSFSSMTMKYSLAKRSQDLTRGSNIDY